MHVTDKAVAVKKSLFFLCCACLHYPKQFELKDCLSAVPAKTFNEDNHKDTDYLNSCLHLHLLPSTETM